MGQRIKIKRAEASTTLKMLGARKAGTLDKKEETNAMTTKMLRRNFQG